MIVTPDTWIISDTHFGHKNIVAYCDRPEDHDTIMSDEWVQRVKPSDTVLHLGDLAVWYGPNEKYWLEVASFLPGEKYMIRGNHDKLKDSEYAKLGYTIIPEFIQEIDGKRVMFSHYPDELCPEFWDVNIHGHIHNNPLDPRLASVSSRKYINVSVELMGYAPIRLGDLLCIPSRSLTSPTRFQTT